MYVLNHNRQLSRSLIAGIFVAVACIHIVILTSINGSLPDKTPRSETVRLLESFLIETHGTTQTSSRNSSLTTSTSTSSPAEAITTPSVSVAQQNKHKHPNTKNPIQNNQTNKNHVALTLPITHAKHLHNPPPPYPKQSRRRGEQGKVVIAVEIDIEGTSSQAVIHQSSGYDRLDRAALETVKKWRFIPGKKGTEHQKMWVNIPINFVLE